MKLKSVTIATLSALYAVGVGATVDFTESPTMAGKNVVMPTKLQAPEGYNPSAQPQMSDVEKQAYKIRASFGTNRHVTATGKRDKFLKEDDVFGVQTYIVQLHDAPVSTYTGGVSGLEATSVRATNAQSNKLFINGQAINDAVPAYQNFLLQQQQAVVSAANAQGLNAQPRKQFTNALNAFSVEMTPEEAERLSQLGNVKYVSRSVNFELQTYRGPEMIGAGSAWNGTSTGTSLQGEGVIVGIIDTGINTDHVAFADVGDDDYDHENPWTSGVYVGDCAEEEFASLCNDKLIGVRSYDVITDTYPSHVDKNGEDYNGHGSHTAGTAAGNVIIDAEYSMPTLPDAEGNSEGAMSGHTLPRTSGVAPHANIISYQACSTEGCPGEALLAAIDDAILDGVDVINYSISGADENPWYTPVESAFLNAHEAGIVVAASAGNSGDGASTAMHPSPWLMTVAASGMDQAIDLSRDLTVTTTTDHWSAPTGPINGGGLTDAFSGKLTTGTKALALDYNTESYGRSDAWLNAEYCREAFPAGTFNADDIVICHRDSITSGDGVARTQRAENVAAGGAGGFILYNYGSSDSIAQDSYVIPGIHIDRTSGNNLFRYVAREAQDADGDILATIGATSLEIVEQQGDIIAEFSGRGPSRAVPEHLIPSITGPGVDIYAPYADQHPLDGAPGGDWAHLSGTSMSAPHLAGVAALIRQGHPDWSVAEIISAIMMTADENVSELVSQYGDDVEPVDTYVAGSGRVNVDKALRAGLVLDETPENFQLANPDNGGTVRNLNMAELVNFECSVRGCSWVREFRATTDGTWNFEAETGEYGVQLTASPASFSLEAGETQLVRIEANLLDTQTVYGGSNGIEVHARAFFKSEDESLPDLHLPVVLAMAEAELPLEININANRNDGRTNVDGWVTRDSTEFTARAYEPVKATQAQVTLPQTSHGQYVFNAQNVYVDPMADDLEMFEGLHATWITVPENSKRLMTEVVSMDDTTVPEDRFWNAFEPFVHVGIDANKDGVIDYANELVCISNNDEGVRRATDAQTLSNWCNINDPEAGDYWFIIENSGYNSEYISTFTIAHGVVLAEESSDIMVDGPSTTEAGTPFDLDVMFDIDMEEGDRIYSALDFGTEGVNAGNLGTVAVNVLRDKDEVSLDASQTSAKAGDIIDFRLDVAANNTGFDREYALQGEIPAGFKLVEGSMQATGLYTPTDITVEGSVITVSGMQEDSTKWEPRYEMTTNHTDDMCHMPLDINPEGGYIDALTFYGMVPYMGGDYRTAMIAYGGEIGDVYDRYGYGIRIPFNWLYAGNPSMQMYNNGKYDPYKAMYIFPTGFIEFSNSLDAYTTVLSRVNPNLNGEYIETQNGVDAVIAPLWKGMHVEGFSYVEHAHTPLVTNVSEADDVSGITLANYGDGRVLVEWDNMRSGDYAGNERVFGDASETWQTYKYLWDDIYGDNYDMQVLMEVGDYRMGKGEFEFIVAFDNIDQGTAHDYITSGLMGYKGPRNAVGAMDGYRRVQYSHNDSADTITNDTVVCYDYVGPESSAFTLDFQVEVTAEALGNEQSLQFISQVTGLSDSSIANVVTVNSNITVYDIADLTVDENGTVDVTVTYIDAEEDANVISVTGEHITSAIEGNMISITPEADWHGETEVTVTVADAVHSNDAASTSFMLAVTSDGVEFGCTDSSATNFDANANSDNGSCEYPAATDSSKSSGGSSGSMAWLLLMLVPFAGMRAKKK